MPQSGSLAMECDTGLFYYHVISCSQVSSMRYEHFWHVHGIEPGSDISRRPKGLCGSVWSEATVCWKIIVSQDIERTNGIRSLFLSTGKVSELEPVQGL